jgi:hypothetical protein
MKNSKTVLYTHKYEEVTPLHIMLGKHCIKGRKQAEEFDPV